nr:hypothetical protein [Thermohalobacter berrensis]
MGKRSDDRHRRKNDKGKSRVSQLPKESTTQSNDTSNGKRDSKEDVRGRNNEKRTGGS